MKMALAKVTHTLDTFSVQKWWYCDCSIYPVTPCRVTVWILCVK